MNINLASRVPFFPRIMRHVSVCLMVFCGLTLRANDYPPTTLTGPAVAGGTDTNTWNLQLTWLHWDADTTPIYRINFTTSVPASSAPGIVFGVSAFADGDPVGLAGGQPTVAEPYTPGWYWGSHNIIWFWHFTPDAYPFALRKQDQKRVDQHDEDDPVQLATGAESNHRTLFTFNGARQWSFGLTYNSMLATSRTASPPMALGWVHDFQAALEFKGSGVVVHWDQNSENLFTPTAGDPTTYASAEDGGRYVVLKSQADGTWLLTRRDQTSLLFNASGQLVEDRDAQGRKLVLAYAGSQLSSITEPVSGTLLNLAYDANGMLSSLTDATGASVQFAYQLLSGSLLLTQITNQDGKNTTYTYNGALLSSMIDHNGVAITSYGFASGGRIAGQVGRTDVLGSSYHYGTVANTNNATTTYTDHNGNSTVYTFDNQFNLLSETNSLNQTKSYTYDNSFRVTSVTDPLNRTTAYTYDAQGNLLTSTDAAGKVTTNTYDTRNNLLTTTDPLSHVTTRNYDANSNLLTVTDALGRTTTWTYDGNSLPLTMTLPGGGIYHYNYTTGRLVQVSDPNGVVTNFGYDADGRLLYREDALGKRVTYTYDTVGNVLTVTNALNQTTTYVYDHRNRVVSMTDPTGATTSCAYDTNSNIVTATDALGKTTTYAYDGEDRLKTVKDALNRTTTYNYDIEGRLLNLVDPASNATSYEYDAVGQVTAVVDALGKRATTAYDVRGLLTSVTDPLSRTASFTYDDLGRRITAKDPLNRQTGFAYDALNRLQQVTDPGSLVASQGFDADGNRTSLTNPVNAATAFAYDAGGRLTRTTTPAGHASTLTYNARGLPEAVTQPSTHVTTLAYDDAQRLSSTTDPVSTISLTRDAAGRVLTVVEGGKMLTRVYDALGRLSSYTDGDGNVIGYAYDDIGRLTQLTYPGGKHVTYAYDTAGRLSTVTDWANRVTTYNYDAVGRVTQTLRPNGTKQTRTYDAAGQLTQLTELAPDGVTVVYSGNYGYDATGQLSTESLNRVSVPAPLSVVQTFDVDNRLLTHNGAATTFDADGNLLSVASGLTPSTYTYDARNRLTSAGGLTYTYDGENRRVAVTNGSDVTHYVINPNAVLDQVLVRTAPDGTKTFYVYGLGLLHEETGSAVRYYHCDRRGDTVALTDGTGAVTDRASYGAYGELLFHSGSTNTPFLFNGQWGVQADASGIFYHRARYYHPQLRRFLNQDPIGFEGGMNFYAYAKGEPITGIDPSGLKLAWASNADKGKVLQTLNYLNNSPTFRSAWQQLKNSETTYTIGTDYSAINMPLGEFQPGNKLVWNPVLGKSYDDGPGFIGGEVYPALVFAHEVGHAVDADNGCEETKSDKRKPPYYAPDSGEISAQNFAKKVADELGDYFSIEYLGPHYKTVSYFKNPIPIK